MKVPRRTPAARAPVRDRARPADPRSGAGERPGTRAARGRAPGRTETAPPVSLKLPSSAGKRSPFTRRAAVFATVLFLVAVSVAYPAQRYVAQRQHIDELRADVAASAARVSALEQDRIRLGQDQFIEREARRRLHYVMPGDSGFRVEDPWIVTGAEPDAGPAAAVTSDVWWERMMGSLNSAGARVEPVPVGARTAPPPLGGATSVGR